MQGSEERFANNPKQFKMIHKESVDASDRPLALAAHYCKTLFGQRMRVDLEDSDV